MLKPRNRLRGMVAEARLASGRPGSVPAVVQATLTMFRDVICADADLLDALIAEALNPIIRALIKTHGSADDRPSEALSRQLDMWAEEARALVEQIGRESVFVPSRGEFVHVEPDAMTAAEMQEAGQYLIGHGDDCIRRGRSLIRLASLIRDLDELEAA